MLQFIRRKIYSISSGASAFTLIEILITTAILAVVIGVGFLNLANYKNKNTFDLDAQNVLEAIRNGENKALLGANGTGWGIKITSDTNDGYYEIFSGSSYATSSVVTRETLTGSTLFANPAPGFSKTITFAALTGTPSQAESVVLKRSGGTDRYLISLSTLGSLDKVYEQGLVGYWPLDEGLGTTAYDASGGGNNGTITGATWQNSSSCRIGQCLSFGSTVGQLITGTNSGALNVNTTLTLSAWIYPTGPTSSDGLETVLLGVGGYYLSFNYVSNALSCYWYGTNPPGYHTTPTNSVLYNKWTHIACVWDGSHINEYINGVVENTVAVTGTGNSVASFIIGDEGARQFNGMIDDVRIYNRALSASEIQQMYQRY